jgi:hypothetical protein
MTNRRELEVISDLMEGIRDMESEIREFVMADDVPEEDRPGHEMLSKLLLNMLDMTVVDWANFFENPVISWVLDYTDDELEKALPSMAKSYELIQKYIVDKNDENDDIDELTD